MHLRHLTHPPPSCFRLAIAIYITTADTASSSLTLASSLLLYRAPSPFASQRLKGTASEAG